MDSPTFSNSPYSTPQPIHHEFLMSTSGSPGQGTAAILFPFQHICHPSPSISLTCLKNPLTLAPGELAQWYSMCLAFVTPMMNLSPEITLPPIEVPTETTDLLKSHAATWAGPQRNIELEEFPKRSIWLSLLPRPLTPVSVRQQSPGLCPCSAL